MLNIVDKKYNDMLYNTRPTKFSELMSNKYNIVHKKIYNQALNKYIEKWLDIKIKYDNGLINENDNFVEKNKIQYYNAYSLADFKNNAKIFEIPNEEYWQPSKCIIITKPIIINSHYTILRWKVDLTPYWNFYQKKESKDIENLKIDINENINDSEIIGLNYITGKAKLYSENLDKTYEVDFDYLDGNKNKISEDFSLSKTFMANL